MHFLIVMGQLHKLLSRQKSFARRLNADGLHFINVLECQHESDLPLDGTFSSKPKVRTVTFIKISLAENFLASTVTLIVGGGGSCI